MSHTKLTAVGLFSGIGGFELGFRESGISTQLVCEIDELAATVLKTKICNNAHQTAYFSDVRELKSIPQVDILAAGFPCQNLSLVGMNAGIRGAQSSLVDEIFRLIAPADSQIKWVVLENVPFMLWHRLGEAINYVTTALEELGFRWAYRVVDARSFGLPQRRRRVILVASRTEDPRRVLFADDAHAHEAVDDGKVPCAFSWTEGRFGLGWAVNCVPTIRAGSAVGVVSPPAIWLREQDTIVTPNIRDAERLQGFEAGWTDIEVNGSNIKLGARWRMVGNAVPVPLAGWLGERLVEPGPQGLNLDCRPWEGGVWPNAAYNEGRKKFRVEISEWPRSPILPGLSEFLSHEPSKLSARAAAGFLKRAKGGKLKFAPGFLDAVADHVEAMSKQREAA
jgi:DNA (cytosine-5)-methyltransferase 1